MTQKFAEYQTFGILLPPKWTK